MWDAGEPSKNCGNASEPVWDVDLRGPRNRVLDVRRSSPVSHAGTGTLRGVRPLTRTVKHRIWGWVTGEP